MQTVTVRASRPYEIQIGASLAQDAGPMCRRVSGAKTVCIVSCSGVFPLYGKTVQRSLEQAGFRCVSFVFPQGEASKNLDTFAQLLEFLAQQQLTRSDLLAALGGGVTGDLTGFAAACYLRGIDYVQLPTSLLAMADSSVGGKTGVDLPQGKNLCGAFWQPKLVLADPAVLATLPERELRSGMGELVKYAVLEGGDLFDALERSCAPNEQLLARCIRIKEQFVFEDERDTGVRQLLNLGHTFGHAVEAASGYALTHGEAVGTGLAMMCRACREKGLLADADCERILRLLARCSLPTETQIPAQVLLQTLLHDKKCRGDGITLAVPRAIGRCELLRVPVSELPEWLSAGGAV